MILPWVPQFWPYLSIIMHKNILSNILSNISTFFWVPQYQYPRWRSPSKPLCMQSAAQVPPLASHIAETLWRSGKIHPATPLGSGDYVWLQHGDLHWITIQNPGLWHVLFSLGAFSNYPPISRWSQMWMWNHHTVTDTLVSRFHESQYRFLLVTYIYHLHSMIDTPMSQSLASWVCVSTRFDWLHSCALIILAIPEVPVGKISGNSERGIQREPLGELEKADRV